MLGSTRGWRRLICSAVMVGLVVVPASATAGGLSAKSKKAIRAELRKSVKKNPAVVRRRSFLRKAALVNFKLPVTIRVRNPCETSQNASAVTTSGGSPVQNPGGIVPTALNCVNQGTALNELTIPSASVNLGPSLGTRKIAVGGSLAAVVEFNDTYDGGALGNVSVKILPSQKKFLTTSSVPLLWNDDIAAPAKRSDANWMSATSSSTLLPASGVDQGCGDFKSAPTFTGGGLVPEGYNTLFHGYTPAGSTFGGLAGYPGYPYYDPAGPGGYTSPQGFIPIYPGVDGIDQVKTGGVVGNNDWIGTNPNPFPSGSAPVSSGGNPADANLYTAGGTAYNAANTVLRTNALHLAIAPGGTAVNMSTGTPVTSGALPTAQGSQNITMGYSGGQANLFGNIPGKNVGIDVTVNLAATINGVARIMDQDAFSDTLVSGNAYPAVIFNCHQVWTQAVQNYIPGVRLTGSLRIAPAITKDGKVRIAKATVQSDATNPDRVALTACLTAESAYVEYNDEPINATSWGFSDRTTVGKIPYATTSGLGPNAQLGTGLWPVDSNVLPVFQNLEKFDPSAPEYRDFGGNAPSDQPCNTAPYALVQQAGLTGTVGGLPGPTDPAYDGVNYNGSQATVAGDITVNTVSVDVLLGDQP